MDNLDELDLIEDYALHKEELKRFSVVNQQPGDVFVAAPSAVDGLGDNHGFSGENVFVSATSSVDSLGASNVSPDSGLADNVPSPSSLLELETIIKEAGIELDAGNKEADVLSLEDNQDNVVAVLQGFSPPIFVTVQPETTTSSDGSSSSGSVSQPVASLPKKRSSRSLSQPELTKKKKPKKRSSRSLSQPELTKKKKVPEIKKLTPEDFYVLGDLHPKIIGSNLPVGLYQRQGTPPDYVYLDGDHQLLLQNVRDLPPIPSNKTFEPIYLKECTKNLTTNMLYAGPQRGREPELPRLKLLYGLRNVREKALLINRDDPEEVKVFGSG